MIIPPGRSVTGAGKSYVTCPAHGRYLINANPSSLGRLFRPSQTHSGSRQDSSIGRKISTCRRFRGLDSTHPILRLVGYGLLLRDFECSLAAATESHLMLSLPLGNGRMNVIVFHLKGKTDQTRCEFLQAGTVAKLREPWEMVRPAAHTQTPAPTLPQPHGSS